ncbi:hypothetical protein [Nocardioides lijunqiniae]|uniref:hypothetical protein n=1 Tax=Nocardioides lijunqiniae TaxID=2760832 RepID=UPI001877E3CA|nr:hypothetical protein [Nocardioides lijunqiniae]
MPPEHGLPDEDARSAREALAALLLDRIVDGAVAELDVPHVVICTELPGGATTCRGPYPDALAAATAAERQRASLAGWAGEGARRFGVAPLHPPGRDTWPELDAAGDA